MKPNPEKQRSDLGVARMSFCKCKVSSVLFMTIANFKQLSFPTGGVHCKPCSSLESLKGRARALIMETVMAML